MLNKIGSKTKKCIGIFALAAFLGGPLSYTAASVPTASAASYSSHRDHRDWDRDKHKKDDGKDYNKGNVVTAVLVGGVIGAIIAKNT